MKVSANGIEINYVIEGDGPWLTMSHSLASNLTMWDESAGAEQKFKCCVSTRADMARAARLRSVSLDQLPLTRMRCSPRFASSTHWVGLSMGGMIGETSRSNTRACSRAWCSLTTSRRPPGAEKCGRPYPAGAGKRHGGARREHAGALVHRAYRKTHKDVMARIGEHIRSTPASRARRLQPGDRADRPDGPAQGNQNSGADHGRRRGSWHAARDGKTDPRKPAGFGARHHPFGRAFFECRATRDIQQSDARVSGQSYAPIAHASRS